MPYQPRPEINIANLRDFSIKEVIQEATYRLLQQGAYSYNSLIGCLYRHCGLRCVVGLLIPNEVYQAEFEGLEASDVLEQLDYDIEVKDGDLCEVLNALQRLHDSMAQDEVDLTLDGMINRRRRHFSALHSGPDEVGLALEDLRTLMAS